MTANIFGSTGKPAKSNVDRNYVDSKFISMVKNMQLKLNKTGDSMQGNINLGGNKITNCGQPTDGLDVVTKEYVDSDFITLTENLQSKVDKTGGVMQGALNMNNNKIINVEEPTHILDVANKKYVDSNFITKQYMEEEIANLYTLSTVGLVPHLTNSVDETGFFVSTSSYLSSEYMGYKVFNPTRNTQWRVANDVQGESVATNFWIQIDCPEDVRIYKFSIKYPEDVVLVRWKILGRVGLGWEDLAFNTQSDAHTFQLENPSLAGLYRSYRIVIERALGLNPGLIYWQLYTVNPVYRSQ